MAQSRYYSSTAVPTVIVGDITPSQTTVTLQVVTGLPASTPFILALGYNTGSEELVLVTGQAGNVMSPITRGYDGTSATTHLTGAPVRHVWAGIDGNDSRAHEAASTNVHGLAGGAAVVGTTSAQTLTNKTLTSPVINTPAITGGTYAGGTFTTVLSTGGTFVNPAIQEAAVTANAVGDVPLVVTAFPASVVDSVSVKNSSNVDVATIGPSGATVVKPSDTAVKPLVVNAPTATTQNILSTQLNGVDKFTVDSTGVTHSFAGARAGSTNQWTVDANGKPSSTGMTSAFLDSSVSATTASTTYVDTATLVSTTVVVPPSGKVDVTGVCQMYINTAGALVYATLNVTGGTSGVIRASADANALRQTANNTADNNLVPGTQSFIVTSANPGETLTIKWQHRVTAGTGQFDYRNIKAVPLLG